MKIPYNTIKLYNDTLLYITYDNKTILPVNPNTIDLISYCREDYVSDGFKLWCNVWGIEMKCETT